MAVSGVTSNIAPLLQAALDINKQLDDLQRQLGSGEKSDTYAGLGPQSGIAVALNAQLAAISSHAVCMVEGPRWSRQILRQKCSATTLATM